MADPCHVWNILQTIFAIDLYDKRIGTYSIHGAFGKQRDRTLSKNGEALEKGRPFDKFLW